MTDIPVKSAQYEKSKIWVEPILLPTGRVIPGGWLEGDAFVIKFDDTFTIKNGQIIVLDLTVTLEGLK